jgi:putative restriction endonuclease
LQTVQTPQQIMKNLVQLNAYLRSPIHKEILFARDLVRNGICLVVMKHEDKLIFGPSRFVGYVNNTMDAHLNNQYKDGKETNPAIDSSLGFRPSLDQSLEQEYRLFCRREGIDYRELAPFNKPRKYWRF